MTISNDGDRPGLRYAFLVNPVSGSGKGREVFEELPGRLQALGVPPENWLLAKTASGNVPFQARELLHRCDRLVVAGGDGTIGQALEGLRLSGRENAALGVIPLGTGNDLARSLGLLRTYKKDGLGPLLALLLEDRTRPLDLWDVGGRAVLVNYLSFGVDGWITEVFGKQRNLSERAHSTIGNKLRYVQAGLGSITRHLPPDFRLRAVLADGSVLERSLGSTRSFLALNISSYASGLLRTNRSACDDGLLSLVSMPHLWHYQALMATSAFPRLQQRIQDRFLPQWQASSFEVEWSGRNALQVDGEGRRDLMTTGRIDVSRSGRVNVLVGTA